jgi:hypothetical protein
MLSTFWLLTLAGGGLRLVLGLLLRRYTRYRLSISQPVAGVLIILAGLPGFVSPISFPVPLSLTLGFLGVDLVLQRVGRAGE